MRAQVQPDLVGLGVFADVGDGFLHQAVDHQLGAGIERYRRQVADHFHIRALGELAHQNVQRHHQAQVAQGGGPQVFDDAAAQRNALVERFNQMRQTFQRLGCGAGQPRLDACRVQFGRRQQRAQFVVQVARQPQALVLARGLQVVGQFGQLGRAALDLDLQAVALGLHGVLQCQLLGLQRSALLQVQVQRQQAHRAERGHADAADHQRALQVGSACFDAQRLMCQQLGRQRADRVHLLAVDVDQHQIAQHTRATVAPADRLCQLRQLGQCQGAQLVEHRH